MQVNVPHKGQLVVQSRIPKASATKVLVVNSTASASRNGKSHRRRNRRTKVSVPRGLGPGISNAYMRCLADPFNNPPVRAGFGCLVPSQVHTAYYRGSFNTGTDGAFTIAVLPNYFNFLCYQHAVSTALPVGTSSNVYASANKIILNNLCNGSRPLAMGLRIIPMIPATATPGIIALGCAPRCALADAVDLNGTLAAAATGLFNQPTTTVIQAPYLREHMARPGGADFFQVTWRPTDGRDFEFTDEDAAIIAPGATGTDAAFWNVSTVPIGSPVDTQGSFLLACGQGLNGGSTTTFYIEACFHFESIATSRAVANLDADNIQPSLADAGTHSTFESLYRSVRGSLPSVDQVAGAATSLLASPVVQRMMTRYAQNSLLGVRTTGYELL